MGVLDRGREGGLNPDFFLPASSTGTMALGVFMEAYPLLASLHS